MYNTALSRAYEKLERITKTNSLVHDTWLNVSDIEKMLHERAIIIMNMPPFRNIENIKKVLE